MVTATHAAGHLVEVDGSVHRISREEGGVVRAPAPALVVALPVAAGQEVCAGAPIAVLESMKMETVLPAPFAGRLRELLVAPNDQVGAGQPLLHLEPLANGNGTGDATAGGLSPVRLDLPEPAPAAGADHRVLRCLDDLRSLLLGFDLTPEDGRRSLGGYHAATAELDDRTTRPWLRAELGVLTVFADLCELTRNRPLAEESPDERVHSPREFFHAYLHSLDVDRERLPQDFRDKLARVLAHYGVTSLERAADLEEAVFRVFVSQQRAAIHLPVVVALLERWLSVTPPRSALAQRAYEVLDRVVLAAQLRFPAIGDLARSARYRWFEAPAVEAARTAAYATVREQLHYLSAHPQAPDHDGRIEALVASPEPVVRFLAERIAGDLPESEPLLEVLARRHYREYTLGDLRAVTVSGRPLVTATYTLDDRPTYLISTIAAMADLPQAATVIESALAQAPAGHQGVVDLYLAWPDAPASIDASATRLREVLRDLPFTGRVRRVAVTLSVGNGDAVHQVTFRPGPDGVVIEDELVRGLHPMVARRLDLWRLRDFRISRLDDHRRRRPALPVRGARERVRRPAGRAGPGA